ncbi:MAG: translation initiation factor IF-2 [Elusimicrobiota bacterium]
MVEKKKTAKKKPAAKKKSAAKKTVKKKTAKKAKKKVGGGTVRRAKADVRTEVEAGSIAPVSAHMVDAFAKFRTAKRRPVNTPSVTRLPAGGSLPRPPEPVKKAPPSPAQPPAPAAAAPAAPAAPVAPVAPPKPEAPKPAASPAAPPAKAEPKKAAIPEPRATYKIDPSAMLVRPAPRPVPRPGPKPKPGRRSRPKAAAKAAPAPEAAPTEKAAPKDLKKLKISTIATVREFAEKMMLSPNELIKKLIAQGVFVTINQRLDSDTATIIAADYGFELEVVPLHMEEEIVTAKQDDKPEDLKPRSPIVTVMGHVDHGKTSLLDAIRNADVVSGESGGITQHIGAYKVHTSKGEIAFLDTPGHEAFTAMRSRGAKVTDIVVLVVSAADGIQPQTVEAIDHAKEAGVPIVVAVNKIDLPQANPQKVRQDLAGRGLNPEEWGGKTLYVDVSAKKKQGLDKLLEAVILQAEMLELKANPDRAAVGSVIEAQMDKKRGAVATVLIQKGTLRVGDAFVMGLAGGKIKALVNDHGDRIRSAGPATPVEVLGITGNIPLAGDSFSVVADERIAKDITQKRNRIAREEALAHKQHVSLLNLKSGGVKQLPIIITADVQGSAEAIKDSLEKMSTDEIKVRVIHAGLGNANESDVLLASASDAIILLFHTSVDTRTKEMAEKAGVEVRTYEIIYDLTADVKAGLEGLLEPEEIEKRVGVVEIKVEFKIRKTRVAGCQVIEGKAVRGALVKITREGAPVGEGRIESLKRFKDDAKTVENGQECGLQIDGFIDWKVGDRLEVIEIEKRVRRLAPSA